jgi:signal transduction histidine kinase
MHIRSRLLVLVLAILVPAFASGVLAVCYVYQQEHADQERSVSESARALAMLVDKELQSREAVLQTLARAPALARGDLAEFDGYIRSLVSDPTVAIVLQDLSGKQLLNTRVPAGRALPQKRFSNVAALIERYGAERPLVSDVFYAPIAKRFDFTVQAPVVLDGKLSYFVTMGINAASLRSLFDQQRFPAPWVVTVVDRNGAVVTRTRDQAKFEGTLVRSHTRNIIGAAREGAYHSVTLDGVPVRAFFATIPRANWKILVSIPESEIRRVPLIAAALLALLTVVLLIIALLAAGRTARRSIAPIEHLGTVADQLGRGEDISYRAQGLHEIDKVGRRLTDAAAQIKAAKSELERRIEVAVATNERARAALIKGQQLEALGRLTGGIAHDFNNLLQTLMSALQVAAMVTDQSRVRELIATCQAAVKKATELTAQLGSFGKVQQARLEILDVRAALQKHAPLLQSAMGSQVTMRVDLAESLWPVQVDPVQFELALINIAHNARDAMPAGGAFRISAENASAPDGKLAPEGHATQSEFVLLRMTDTGSGMSPAVLANAPNPFFTTKPLGQANGLGLAQVDAFATQCGGWLRLASVEGQGATIELYLPRAAMPAQATTPAALATPSTARSVLFVDDDALLRGTVGPALEQAGFRVALAATGDEALALLDGGLRPDVVFSDIVMPGRTSGIALAAIVRQRYPQIGMMLATGYSDKTSEFPDVPVLSKPYHLAAAIATLNECCRSAAPPLASPQ